MCGSEAARARQARPSGSRSPSSDSRRDDERQAARRRVVRAGRAAPHARAPPGVVADPAPINPGSGFGSGLGLGPGSAAAASGAESTLAPEAVLAARQHLCALIPLFVNRTLELYAALGPHPTTIQSLLALLALFTYAGRPLEAEETAARLWDTLRAATFPQGLGENPQTLSALRLQYASMVRLATAHPFPMP